MLSILDGFWIPFAARLAWEIGLFETLATKGRTVAEVARALGLAERPVEALAAAAASLDLLRRSARHGEWLELTPTARAYLVSGSPWSMAPVLDMMRHAEGGGEGASDAEVSGTAFLDLPDLLRLAVSTDRPQLPREVPSDGVAGLERLRSDAGFANRFTAAMEAHGRPAAQAWPRRMPLEGHRVLLDLAGGSGVHARAALSAYPHLSAIVLELPEVVEAAERLGFSRMGEEADAEGGACDRLRFVSGDLWHDRWPDADVHFFSDVFHDWSVDRGRELAGRSFARLPAGGRIIVHELLLDDDRSGPAPVVASTVSMLLWTEGRQYSAEELKEVLGQAGFVEIEVERTLGCWGLVSGRKPEDEP